MLQCVFPQRRADRRCVELFQRFCAMYSAGLRSPLIWRRPAQSHQLDSLLAERRDGWPLCCRCGTCATHQRSRCAALHVDSVHFSIWDGDQ
jgi:hypothetical protein